MKPLHRLIALILLASALLSTAIVRPSVHAQDDDPAAQWKQQAEDALSLEILPEYDPENPPAPELAPIYRTRVIANNYYTMYQLNPAAYKWSGLAALVACSIYGSLVSGIGQTVPPPFDQLPAIFEDGNLAVYEDLYWQHLAFADGGIAEMERLFEADALDETSIAAWRSIADGLANDDPDAIWAGNTELLRTEQAVVLQPIVYDGHEALWAILQTLPAAMASPVPNDPAIFDAKAGVFSTFEDRWVWIADHIFPAWRAFELTDNAMTTYIKTFNPCWIPTDDDPRRD